MAKQQVTIRIDEDLYSEYKKALIDLKTNTTADLIRHIKRVVEQHKKEGNE